MPAHPQRQGAWRRLLATVLLAGPCVAGAADLLDAYRRGLANDATFLAARANAAAAREAVPQARAGLLPNLSFNASRSKNNTDITQQSVFGPLTSNSEYFSEGQNLTLRQPLFRRANLAQYRQAQAQVAGAEVTLEKERQNLTLRVAGAYFDALAAQEQLRFAVEQKKTYYEQWQRALVMLDRGAGTRTDRDESKARYDGVAAQEIDAANALDLAERTLASITGRPVSAAALAPLDALRLPLRAPAPASFDEWVALAVETNPELASLRYGIEVYAQEVDKQRSGHLPTLDLIAQRSYSSSESVSIIGRQFNTDLVGLQVSIPLYSGGAIVSAVRQALAGLERARQQYEAGKRQVTIELRREYNNVGLGISKVRALEEALKSARLAFASTEMGVRAGTRNTLDVLNARQQIYSAQRDLGKARYDYVVGGLRLKAAAGTLGEGEMESINRWLAVGGAGHAGTPVFPDLPAARTPAVASLPAAIRVAAHSQPVPDVAALSPPVPDELAQARDLVEHWRRAWSSRDVDAYLGCYSANFVSARGQTRTKWAKARRRNLSSRSEISVQVHDLRIERIDTGRLKAVFLQDYASDRYREVAQPKTLLLVRAGDDWRIAQEWQGTKVFPVARK